MPKINFSFKCNFRGAVVNRVFDQNGYPIDVMFKSSEEVVKKLKSGEWWFVIDDDMFDFAENQEKTNIEVYEKE